MEECGEIPCCVVRPGMITPSLAEPREGWITNVYGPTAFVAANLKGICKLANADNEINADLVPVDFVVNGCIVAAVKTAVDAKNKQRFVFMSFLRIYLFKYRKKLFNLT